MIIARFYRAIILILINLQYSKFIGVAVLRLDLTRNDLQGFSKIRTPNGANSLNTAIDTQSHRHVGGSIFAKEEIAVDRLALIVYSGLVDDLHHGQRFVYCFTERTCIRQCAKKVYFAFMSCCGCNECGCFHSWFLLLF